MSMFQHNQDGFSLVETLVAITILLIVIVGPMTISVSTAKSTSFASEQVVAFFLAQEGAELVQKYRDDQLLQAVGAIANNNLFAASFWSSFTDTSSGPLAQCYTAAGCGVEVSSTNDGGVLVGNSTALYRDTAGTDRSKYTHVSTGIDKVPTPFTRVVTVRNIGTDSIEITSTVTWRTGSLRAGQQVEVQTYVYNVYGN